MCVCLPQSDGEADDDVPRPLRADPRHRTVSAPPSPASQTPALVTRNSHPRGSPMGRPRTSRATSVQTAPSSQSSPSPRQRHNRLAPLRRSPQYPHPSCPSRSITRRHKPPPSPESRPLLESPSSPTHTSPPTAQTLAGTRNLEAMCSPKYAAQNSPKPVAVSASPKPMPSLPLNRLPTTNHRDQRRLAHTRLPPRKRLLSAPKGPPHFDVASTLRNNSKIYLRLRPAPSLIPCLIHYKAWKHVLDQPDCPFPEARLRHGRACPSANRRQAQPPHGLCLPSKSSPKKNHKDKPLLHSIHQLEAGPEVLEHIEAAHGHVPFASFRLNANQSPVPRKTLGLIGPLRNHRSATGDYTTPSPNPEPFLIVISATPRIFFSDLFTVL